MSDETPPKITDTWEFDNYSSCHPERTDNITLEDTSYGQRLTIKPRGIGDAETLVIHADRDQWGTWITLQIGDKGFTIAQEDGTRSFMSALIAALEKLKGITDCGTLPPTHNGIDPAFPV